MYPAIIPQGRNIKELISLKNFIIEGIIKTALQAKEEICLARKISDQLHPSELSELCLKRDLNMCDIGVMITLNNLEEKYKKAIFLKKNSSDISLGVLYDLIYDENQVQISV